MKTIQIEDDVYNHLLKEVKFIGEDASAILRRLLGIRSDHSGRGQQRLQHQGHVYDNSKGEPSSLDECIQHHLFRAQRDVIGKFLFALSWLAQKHKTEFKRVFDLKGRKRIYFANTQEELEESGRKVMPQQIPNTDFWVVTNNSTPKKREMLYDVLRVLGYSATDCNRLVSALE
jgi:negative modulator of initiation of replication